MMSMQRMRLCLLLALGAMTITLAAGPPEPSGTMNMMYRGKQITVPIYSLGKQNPNGNSINIPYNTRGYVGAEGKSATQWSQNNYFAIPLTGYTLSYTVDMGTVAAGCNAAVYTVTMPSQQPGESKDYYCDANQVGGNWCAEMDLLEANALAGMITPHKCDSPTGPCDKTGCGHNSRNKGDWFKAGGKINPKQPFNMSFQFIGSGNSMTDLISTVSQGSQSVQEHFGQLCGASYLSAMGRDFSGGMTLVFSYWGAQGGQMSWLDGDKSASCPGGGSFTVSNIVVSSANDPVNPCATNPCKNGGSCSGSSTAVCSCTQDYTGSTCETSKCSTIQCKNGGVCSAGKCSCAQGYSGDTCETKAGGQPCSTNPCKNGGSCSGSTGSAVCTCTASYTGSTCETLKCSTMQCQNGGVCNAGKCSCPEGFSGTLCQTGGTVEDPCDPNPCKNNGVCAEGTCKCSSKWKGDYCQTPVQTPVDPCAECPDTCQSDDAGVLSCPSVDNGAKSSDTSATSSTLWIIVMVVGAILVLGVVLFVINAATKPSGPSAQFLKQGTAPHPPTGPYTGETRY